MDMEKNIIKETSKKGIFEILQLRISGLEDNGHYDFYYSVGFYKLARKNARNFNLYHQSKFYVLVDADVIEKHNIKHTIEIPKVFKSCDFFGVPTNGIQDAKYFIDNDKIDILDYLKGHNIHTDMETLNEVKKYNNYNFALWYISENGKVTKPLLKEFHNELSKYFDYDNFDVVSPNLLGSLNSMLNGEFNAVLVKYLTREQREKISLNDLLDIFKNNPNSDYDYKIKERKLLIC